MLGDQPSVAYPANFRQRTQLLEPVAGVRDTGKHGVLDILYSKIEGEAISHIYPAVDEGFMDWSESSSVQPCGLYSEGLH